MSISKFVRALLDQGLCEFATLLARFESFRAGVFANAVPDRLGKLAQRLRDWKRDDLARFIITSTEAPNEGKR